MTKSVPIVSDQAATTTAAPTRRSRAIWGREMLAGAAALIGVALLGGLLWTARSGSDGVATVAIATGNISASVNALGTLEPLTSVDVGAQVSGQIVRLAVAPGDRVEKGQLLAEIDPSILQATVDAGRAELAGLRADLAEQQAQAVLAGQNYDRQRQMEREGATRAEDVQTATANWRAAGARVDRLRANIDKTASGLKGNEAQLGFTRIYAPMTGTVVSVEARAGQTLNAAYQTPTILSIADLSHMTVKVSVAEADIRQVRPGMTASFTTLGDEARHWSGRVRQVLPAPPKPAGETKGEATASKIVMYTVLFDVANADGALMPGMTAQVAFATQSARGVLVAPLAALSPEEGRTGYYRARVLDAAGTVQSRTVRTGMRDRMNAEILSGLARGDRIVTGEAPAP